MQMTVKPVVPDPAHQSERVPTPVRGAATARERSAPSPWIWISAALTSFIDMVEPIFARLSGGRRLVAIESADGKDLAFFRVSGKRVMSLGTSKDAREPLLQKLRRAGGRDVELRLDPERLATARFKIPAGGAAFARQIVESRLDRLTPWRPEDVIHGFALSNKPGPDGQIDVDFVATSRVIASASSERLAEFGVNASALGSSEHALTGRMRIDLYGGVNDTARAGLRRAIGIGAIAAMAVSAFVSGTTFYSLIDSRENLADLDMRLAKARNRLVLASGSSADRDADAAFIAEKTPARARFHLIDRLAAILPDTTYLDELDIEPGTIRIAGSSTEASGLIKRLEDDAAFSDVRFAAPVTRQDDGRDRFEISLSTAGKPAEPTP